MMILLSLLFELFSVVDNKIISTTTDVSFQTLQFTIIPGSTTTLLSQQPSITDFDSTLFQSSFLSSSVTAVDRTTSSSVIPSEVSAIPYIAVGVSAVVLLLLIVCSSLIVLLIVIHHRRRRRSVSKDNG